MSKWQEARNIVAIRLDNIGDVVMLGPALRAVKATLPDARLTLLASRAGASAAPLLPWVDDVMVWKPVWQDVGQKIPFDPARERQMIDDLAERHFDAALIFTSFSQTPHVPGYICYLAGIPLRAGESKEFGGSTLTTEIRGAPDDMQQAERNLRLVEQLGFPVGDRRLAVQISDEARQSAGALLREVGLADGESFILVHPGASAQARRIPAELGQEIVRWLDRRGWRTLITGADKEAELVQAVADRGGEHVDALVGRTTLPEFAALIERASLVICGNTLPLHLAEAVNTPVVVLYSGTDLDEQWRPRFTASRLLRRPTACYPCYRFDCPIGQPCLDIPVQQVIESVQALLAESGDPRIAAGKVGAR